MCRNLTAVAPERVKKTYREAEEKPSGWGFIAKYLTCEHDGMLEQWDRG